MSVTPSVRGASALLPLLQVNVLEVAGLLCHDYLRDAEFQSFCQRLRALDMGRNPAMMIDSLAHWSRVYEYPYTLYGIMKYLEDRHLRGARILDAACGFSPIPFLLAALGHQVVGIDLDAVFAPMWEGYVLPTDRPGGKAEFKIDNMEKLEYADNSFDVAFSVSSLEHTPRPELAVRELCRIVKPGGLVLLTCDLEPPGSEGIPFEKFVAMLEELDQHTEYLYPARWCHPQEAVSFATRSAALAAPWWRKALRSLRPSNNMVIHATARRKRG